MPALSLFLFVEQEAVIIVKITASLEFDVLDSNRLKLDLKDQPIETKERNEVCSPFVLSVKIVNWEKIVVLLCLLLSNYWKFPCYAFLLQARFHSFCHQVKLFLNQNYHFQTFLFLQAVLPQG